MIRITDYSPKMEPGNLVRTNPRRSRAIDCAVHDQVGGLVFEFISRALIPVAFAELPVRQFSDLTMDGFDGRRQ